jgi:hypothetical protein
LVALSQSTPAAQTLSAPETVEDDVTIAIVHNEGGHTVELVQPQTLELVQPQTLSTPETTVSPIKDDTTTARQKVLPTGT